MQPFRDLTNDPHEEIGRRPNKDEVTILPAREGLHSEHNKARQDLANFPTTPIEDRCSEVDLELAQLYNEFKENLSGMNTTALNCYDSLPTDLRPNPGQQKDGCTAGGGRPASETESDEAKIGRAMASDLVHEPDLDQDAGLEGLTGPLPITSHGEENEGQEPAVDRVLVPPWENTNPEDLTGSIVRDSTYPVNGGGYADVYRGTLSKDGLSTKVAVKVIRSHTFTVVKQYKIDKRLRREIRVWSCLQHPSILPLLGTTTSFSLHTAMVCPWMEEGNLNHYLSDRKSELNLRRRLEILTDTVEGLSYLHAQSIIHGDLTTANILMKDGKALLTDFGLSNIAAELRTISFISSTVAGAARWAAPELYPFCADVIPEVTKRCDIYSFGSVALQVISGKIPYDDIRHDILVLMEIMKGNKPPRPSEPLLSDDLWGFIVICWDRRPGIDKVREMLQVCHENCSDEALETHAL